MVELMQRFLTQNYTISAGFLHATTPFIPLPPFEAPLWAIRVNVLWFTSLILSLSSASLGMLVKQWLREYLALKYTSPKERLRARQYRSPALARWKVFEIAAVLPLLLQASLGLFFLGLCFFTSAIHSSIGHTTIPVVSAWVFFFMITTIAPIFSPRCPFKTTFLNTTLKACRRFIAPPTRSAMLLFSLYADRLVDTVSVCVAGRRRIRPKHPPPALEDLLLEEEEVVRTEQEDTDILLSVDGIMSDDALLPAMIHMLQQQQSESNL